MKVVIHAGVAFSEQDRLSETLLANADALAQQRIRPLDAAQGRQFVKVASDAMAGNWQTADVQRHLQDILPDQSQFDRVIVFSDKFFGPRRTAILHEQLYPFAGERARYVDQTLPEDMVELTLGLVNPATFISKMLMSLPEERRHAVLGNTDLSCLNWLSMVEDLLALAPGVSLTLWANEDAPLIWGDILRAMTGLPKEATIQHEYGFLASLLTETGRAELGQLMQQMQGQDQGMIRSSLAALFDEHADPVQIEEELELPGWNADIVTAFTEIYQQDMAKIRTLPRVRVLEP